MQTSRRDAMLGATAATVVTGAATAPLAIKATGVKAALVGEPLVALEAELMEARAACSKVSALWSTAYHKTGDWAFGWPRIDFSNPAMEKMSGWLEHDSWFKRQGVITLDEIKKFNRHTQNLTSGEELARCKAEGRERIRWWIKARRAQDAAQEAAGLPQFGALCDSATERTNAIEDQIWDTPAETLPGVVIRLREALRDYTVTECSGEGDFYVVVFGKVLRDLERLAGETRS